ncbi:pre-rRNA-processing protein IPI3 [Cryptococcus wingfieldii CBS 7118]|uniref:Pre-rRNA-processing protein IPI3 n=1 Tax=Cryptococcus wingfieldii CBS 7118 TaxID=1295528 RepID=A0A1E3ISB7_9TREE|nr:pre-rRNA-processing protein IPI3 [Cryptococcus wingfieldii CBS 7118]ODN91469.1 pre-rRNA-processing protein IPI3 [Cryptococcus wingfieldii CBS 7118]
MSPQELVLSSPQSASTAAIHLHDLLSSAPVHQFKSSTSPQHSVAHVQSQNAQGGAIFAVQHDKALLNVWAWQKDQMHLKLHLPEKMTAFTVSPNGHWAAGGSPNGHIYLWEIASGLLLSSHTAHYRAITSLTFTPDSRLLLSTSLDSSSQVYLVSRLVDPEDPASAGKPYGTLKDHTLAVRCLAVGKVAGSEGGRAWTASDDGTVKMWSLRPPFDLLCTFSLPPTSSPAAIVVDPSERFLYVATSQGDVYHIPLFRNKGTIGGSIVEGSEEWEAVGGSGNSGVPIKAEGAVISVNDAQITSLSLSLSSTHLLLGTSSGTIQIHSLPSHQHLRTLSPHAGPVTYLTTILRPFDLVGTVGMKGEEMPIMEVKSFERMKGRAAKEAHDPVLLVRPPSSEMATLLGGLKPTEARQKIGGRAADGNMEEQMEELAKENQRLREAVDRASRINEKMWTGILDSKLGNQE